MFAPSTICLTLECENEITRDGLAVTCGQWVVVTRGDELPYCYACKQPRRSWRFVTPIEIAHRDGVFLRLLECLPVGFR